MVVDALSVLLADRVHHIRFGLLEGSTGIERFRIHRSIYWLKGSRSALWCVCGRSAGIVGE